MGIGEIGQWLFFLAPYLLLLGAYVGVLRWAFGSLRSGSIRVGVVASLLAVCSVMVQAWWHFLTTWSSMGGLGLFFSPFYAALIGVVGYLGIRGTGYLNEDLMIKSKTVIDSLCVLWYLVQ